MNRLPFKELWAVDFEFEAPPGEAPRPVCMVARELRSGHLLRLWRDELPSRPPFPVDSDSLLIAYVAQAELGCFLALGWPLPARVLDLYAEFRAITNGSTLPHGRGLLGALAWYGLSGITKEEKHGMRELVLRGGPWTQAERADVLSYCQGDVDVLEPLLERMLPAIRARRGEGLGQALLRGRGTAAVARMERTGVPVDTAMLERLRKRWAAIKLDLIAEVDRCYRVFDGATFKIDRFERWLGQQGIPWPRTETGRLQLDKDLFHEMGRSYPAVRDLATLRRDLAELRLEKIAVGADGRNRVSLWPFGASSGRNTPPATQFIFGPSVWLRGLIRPEPGRSLAYVDWSCQEVAIAAALSGDQALLDAVSSGDPYITFAKLAGLAPEDATKKTHKDVRDLCKVCLLGTNYGLGVRSLALRTGTSVMVAEQTQRAVARAFPTFWRWADHTIERGELRRELSTVFGWRLGVGKDTKATTLRNFPAQGNGAEMLRLACCLATERGVQVCAPVHDALLVEADAGELYDVVGATQEAMSEAARAVLDGVAVATEATVVQWPDRYADPRGVAMWERVTALLDREAARYGDDPAAWPAIEAPKPILSRRVKGSGERRGLTGQVRCAGCGKWVRPRPEAGDWDAAEREYKGDEYEEHYCEADFGAGIDPTTEAEWAAWEAAERERLELESAKVE